MVGLVTLVIILVGSVTSTCLRSSLGDMRTYSAPILPISSGGWPGHNSTTRGLSATAFFSSAEATDQATHTQEMNEILANRFMMAPLHIEIHPAAESHRGDARQTGQRPEHIPLTDG